MNDSKLLELFEQAGGGFVSGEELSARLEISRTAVWKQIERLRQQGYRFEAFPRKGYRLLTKPDKLDIGRLMGYLRTSRLGQNIRYVEQVSSTQTLAHELVAKGEAEGTVVLAEQQSAGKGRMGRSFHSPRGKGIWMSVVLKPLIPLSFTPQLTLLTAVAVCRAIRTVTAVEAGIKWPNDILIDGRKVCGILLETSAEDERLLYIIAGIGLSVNLQKNDFPQELQDIATSLLIESGQPVEREKLIALILKEWETLYELYLNQGFAPIRLLWEALSVSLNRPIRIRTLQGEVTGEAERLDDSGALFVRLEDGARKKIYSGDVEFR